MKYLLSILTILILTACNSRIDYLSAENEKLKNEIDSLKLKVKIIDNAFIIPYDSITSYMMPVTYGSPELKIGEKDEYVTMLAWSKFPEGINYSWKITNGKGVEIINDSEGVNRYVEISYPTSGEKEERGAYFLTMPNGNQVELNWLKPTIVK